MEKKNKILVAAAIAAATLLIVVCVVNKFGMSQAEKNITEIFKEMDMARYTKKISDEKAEELSDKALETAIIYNATEIEREVAYGLFRRVGLLQISIKFDMYEDYDKLIEEDKKMFKSRK